MQTLREFYGLFLIVVIVGYFKPDLVLFWYNGLRNRWAVTKFVLMPFICYAVFLAIASSVHTAIYGEEKQPVVLKENKPTQISQPLAPVTQPLVQETTNTYSKSAPTHTAPKKHRRTNSGHQSNYIRGPRGGCYYINGYGKKVYVDRDLCN